MTGYVFEVPSPLVLVPQKTTTMSMLQLRHEGSPDLGMTRTETSHDPRRTYSMLIARFAVSPARANVARRRSALSMFLAPLFYLQGALAQQSGNMHVSVIIPDSGGINQCAPVRFVWTGGQAPYILSIVHPGDSQPLDQFINIGLKTTLRRIKVPAGSSAQAVVADGTGLVARSDPFNVGAGSNTTCLDKEITAFLPINGTASLTSNAPSSTSAAVSPTATSSSDATSSSSRSPGAGEIAGIVLGCIALLFVLGAVLLCLRRRRRRRVILEDISVTQYTLSSDPYHTLEATDVKNPLVLSYTPPSPTSDSRPPSSLSSNTAPLAIDSAPASHNAELSGPALLNILPPALTAPTDSRRSRSTVLLTTSPKVGSDSRSRTARTQTSGQSLQWANDASLRTSTFTRNSGRAPIQDTDGGVRLAGGPPAEMVDDLQSEVSILPPPYRPYR